MLDVWDIVIDKIPFISADIPVDWPVNPAGSTDIEPDMVAVPTNPNGGIETNDISTSSKPNIVTRLYDFHFPIFNPTADNFVGVHLEFNCNITIMDINGIKPDSPIVNYALSGSNSDKIDIKFQLRKIGSEGIKIYAHSESSEAPRLEKVELIKETGRGRYSFTEIQIKQLNDEHFPT